MRQILFGIQYLIGRRLLGKNIPLIAGLDITYSCNLSCRHCKITERETEDMSFEEAVSILDTFYQEGGRIIYFEGGEPFLWRDGNYGLDDLIRYARKRGYLSAIIYTNGTISLDTSADTVFISVDGLKETHDGLRGNSFDIIMKNIRQSAHPSLFINCTINNSNKNEIEKICQYIDGFPNIRGIFFYFHTPYYGHDDLYIEQGERSEILHRLLHLKKRFRILNSKAGLTSALNNDWARPLTICRIYEKGKRHECCKYPDDPELCRNCGYLSYAEIDQTLKLKPSAIMNALKYF
jgi:MoaA/NifB/PqqE/SkfB family radical SAM enzyme